MILGLKTPVWWSSYLGVLKIIKIAMMKNLQSENLWDEMPSACLRISQGYVINSVNPFFTAYLNQTDGDILIGKSIFEILAPEDHHKFTTFVENIRRNLKDQWEMFRLVDSQGNEKPLLVGGNMSQEGQGILLVGLPSSSSPHMMSKYELLFESAPMGMAFLDKHGHFEAVNAAFCDHFNTQVAMLLQKHYAEVLKDTLSEQIQKLGDLLAKSHQTYLKDVLSFSTEKGVHRIFEITLYQINDDQNQVDYSLLLTEEITNQRDTHIALLQSEKLALTGRLAASLAHEINNPLQTSLGCLGLVEEMLDEDDQDLRIYINLAIEELQRSARIVKKLRDLNRSTNFSERMPVDLHELLEGVLVLTKNQLSDRNITPILSLPDDPAIISVSRDQVQQVLLNLVMNAIDEMPNGGHIYLQIIPSDEPRGARIIIRDTGPGIKPEIAGNIFEPFFSTKEDGIGLGLYICKQIIENHGGTLNFVSQPGSGTEFSIWIPDQIID